MDDTVIKVEAVSKKYTIGVVRHDTLRDRLTHALRFPWRRGPEADPRDFWALREVSFELKRGEVIGVIGRNGAGKSTLLKVLSRITDPTSGRICIKGRIGSLLEVGTGFHPELTGRENIFLNGAILGMRRVEIMRKFDEIVAFAEIGRFLDTPVKHYSSGMYVRLAFAVAAHLEPEILIVDEVLAVGDAAFQKKCLGKMSDVARQDGRTILFVSHNLFAIRQLCQSALLLADGRMAALGKTPAVLNLYAERIAGHRAFAVPPPPKDLLDRAYVTQVTIESDQGKSMPVIPVGQPWRIRVGFRLARRTPEFVVAIGLRSPDGTSVQTAWRPPETLEAGDYEAFFLQDRVVLEAGSYVAVVGLSESDRSIQQIEAERFDITGESAVGYLPQTSGIGPVLNSMAITLSRV